MVCMCACGWCVFVCVGGVYVCVFVVCEKEGGRKRDRFIATIVRYKSTEQYLTGAATVTTP